MSYFVYPNEVCQTTSSFRSGTSHCSLLRCLPLLIRNRRPISRVKPRTSRQGLPVDDEDDADEEGHDLVLVEHPAVTVAVDPAEPTSGGIEANGPWKSKSVSRAHASGENDVDGDQSPESHVVRGRKGKGELERARTTSLVDREPWAKAEHPSNQDSYLETPSMVTGLVGSESDGIKADCILPLLRQLQAATSNGDSCLKGCSPSHEREVWTCGQNSYGELGHSDTGTRKIHCLVKPFEGKEVVDIAAGTSWCLPCIRTHYTVCGEHTRTESSPSSCRGGC